MTATANTAPIRRTSSSPLFLAKDLHGTNNIDNCGVLTNEDVPGALKRVRTWQQPQLHRDLEMMAPMIAPMERTPPMIDARRTDTTSKNVGDLNIDNARAHRLQPPDREFHRGADLHRRGWSRPDRILGGLTGSPTGCR